MTEVSTRPGKLAHSSGGDTASMRIDDTLPPSTSPVIARLSAIGQVSRWRRACRTRTMMTSEKAVNADITGASGVYRIGCPTIQATKTAVPATTSTRSRIKVNSPPRRADRRVVAGAITLLQHRSPPPRSLRSRAPRGAAPARGFFGYQYTARKEERKGPRLPGARGAPQGRPRRVRSAGKLDRGQEQAPANHRGRYLRLEFEREKVAMAGEDIEIEDLPGHDAVKKALARGIPARPIRAAGLASGRRVRRRTRGSCSGSRPGPTTARPWRDRSPPPRPRRCRRESAGGGRQTEVSSEAHRSSTSPRC